MHLNGKVIRNVKDGRAAEPRKEQICNSSHPDGERAEKLKVRVVFKTVLSKMNKAVADGRTDGHASTRIPPLPRRSYLFTVVLIIQAFPSSVVAGGCCLVDFLGRVSQDLKIH